MSTRNRLDLETLGFLCPEISPDTGIMEVQYIEDYGQRELL